VQVDELYGPHHDRDDGSATRRQSMSDLPLEFGSWPVSLQESFFHMRKAEAEAEARKAEAEARKAEADAAARKAEADAAARIAEAEVQKAQLGSAARNVGFECLPIKVTHWNSLVSQYIQVPTHHYSFENFLILVRLAFNDDIKTDEFRLYLLPVDCEIDDRILVDAKRFEEFLGSIKASKGQLPSMYVWNYDTSSPTKLTNNPTG
jgi:hypothetical protein